MAQRLIDRCLTQPGFGSKPGGLFLQMGEVVDHESHDLARLASRNLPRRTMEESVAPISRATFFSPVLGALTATGL